MTQYLVAVVGEPDYDALSPETLQAIMSDVGTVIGEMQEAGVFVFGGGLDGPEATAVVDATDGAPVVTDGPYAETKEILFSFIVIDVEDLDAALAWARRMPATAYGAVQIHASDRLELA